MLGETTGLEHIEIKGCRLPTYKQDLKCLLANIKQMRLSQKGIKNKGIEGNRQSC